MAIEVTLKMTLNALQLVIALPPNQIYLYSCLGERAEENSKTTCMSENNMRFPMKRPSDLKQIFHVGLATEALFRKQRSTMILWKGIRDENPQKRAVSDSIRY